MRYRSGTQRIHVTRAFVGLLVLLWLFTAPPVIAQDVDNDGDGTPAGIDCDDNNPLWNENCWLKAFQGCTNENRFDHDCLPNVSNVEVKLNALHEDLVGMNKDKHTWSGATSRPGDNWPWPASKRHVQSIQYFDYEGVRYIVTSMSDEHDNKATVQLIKTDEFASEGGDADRIVSQSILSEVASYKEFARFNHPGGSQLIGRYLFVALEDFTSGSTPATGVWRIQGSTDSITAQFIVPSTDIPGGDYHQATAAVTKLSDGTYLLAACVGPNGCDNINFYKSSGDWLLWHENLNFTHVDTWNRGDSAPLGLPDDGNNWDECAPQNMNFVAQDDGAIYLVMFGAVNRGLQSTDASGCITGVGYDDHLFGYKVRMNSNNQIWLEFTNKVDVIPNSHKCGALTVEASELHGLNFLAGAGLWPSPNGNDKIAYLATEHYDSCGANTRPVNAKTRWGVSENWNEVQLLTVKSSGSSGDSTVTVDEGDLAETGGNYFDFGGATLSASIGTVIPDAGIWNWWWSTADGPDDSQSVTITREDQSLLFPTDSIIFELVVNNVPPTADAGPDQIVECVQGQEIFLDATGSSDQGADTLSFAWDFAAFPGGGAPPFDDPLSATPMFEPIDLGAYEAEVTVMDDDGAAGTDTVMIGFEDTTPPEIESVSVSPNVLWPPNGKMVPVEVSVSVSDDCYTTPTCSILSIESNEPEGKKPHSEITGDLSAELRAERLGTGSGRVYTVTVECTDGGGNSSTETTAVTVPHDQDDAKATAEE